MIDDGDQHDRWVEQEGRGDIMYQIVAEAKVRDAQRAARLHSAARECGAHVKQNRPNKVLEAVQRLAALTLSFLA
jgi:hypothetical protein